MEKAEKEIKTDYSVFTKRNNQNLKFMATEEPGEATNLTQKVGNVFGIIKGYMKVSKDEEANNPQQESENKSLCVRISESILKVIEVEKSYKNFFIFIGIGIGIILFSLLFLPMVIIAPTKFVSLFSLGSLVTLLSFIFIYGTKEYFGMLFNKSRCLFSILFIISLFLGIYFSIFNPMFVIALVCAFIQLITLIVFTLSFIPGGGAGISFVTSMVLSPFKSFWNKIARNSS